MIDFQFAVASQIQLHPSVNLIIIAKGQAYEDLQRMGIPSNNLLEGQVLEPLRLAEFAPFSTEAKGSIWFDYNLSHVDKTYARAVQDSLKRVLMEYRVPFTLFQNNSLRTDASSMQSNGANKLVVSEATLTIENHPYPRQQVMEMLSQATGHPVIMERQSLWGNSPPPHNTNLTFLSQNNALIGIHELSSMPHIDSGSAEVSRHGVKPILMDNIYKEVVRDDYNSVCGLANETKVTKNFIFLPTFSNDPANQLYPELDHYVISIIRANTSKKVITLPIPNAICRIGLSPRNMLWYTHAGPLADILVNAAQMN